MINFTLSQDVSKRQEKKQKTENGLAIYPMHFSVHIDFLIISQVN